MIEVTLLGTGSPIPDARRAGPSTLVRAGGQTFLIDCGRGVQQRMTAAGTGANALSALLLTHLHSDHIADLGDVIITRWVTTFTARRPCRSSGRPAPPRWSSHADGVLAPTSATGSPTTPTSTTPPPSWRCTSTPRAWSGTRGVPIPAPPTDHRPVEPTIGFRVEHGGASVVLAGDTVPCAGLDALAAGAGALVHTVIRKD